MQYIHIFQNTYTCVYIYIFIDREREKEGEMFCMYTYLLYSIYHIWYMHTQRDRGTYTSTSLLSLSPSLSHYVYLCLSISHVIHTLHTQKVGCETEALISLCLCSLVLPLCLSIPVCLYMSLCVSPSLTLYIQYIHKKYALLYCACLIWYYVQFMYRYWRIRLSILSLMTFSRSVSGHSKAHRLIKIGKIAHNWLASQTKIIHPSKNWHRIGMFIGDGLRIWRRCRIIDRRLAEKRSKTCSSFPRLKPHSLGSWV